MESTFSSTIHLRNLESAVLKLNEEYFSSGTNQTETVITSLIQIYYLCPTDEASNISENPCVQLALKITQGNYLDCLLNPEYPVSKILHSVGEKVSLNENPKKIIEMLNSEIEDWLVENSQALSQLQLVYSAVAALMLFIQVNWTGPSIDESNYTIIPNMTTNQCLIELSVDGEHAYTKLECPQYLLLSRIFLLDNYSIYNGISSLSWWCARCAFKIQQILSGPSETIRKLITLHYSKALYSYEDHPEVYLENGLFHEFYQNSHDATKYFSKAKESSKLYFKLTGVMGRATKYQTFDTPQLVLFAKSFTDDLKISGLETDKDSKVQEIDLSKQSQIHIENEEDIRELTLCNEIDSSLAKSKISALDQCILIAFCLDLKNSNPQHGLTWDQMKAYVNRALENPQNWMINSMALLIKGRLDRNSTKYADRGVLQTQVLIDQFNDCIKDYPVKFRTKYIFLISFPARFKLKSELAHAYKDVGAYRSALDLFNELELWIPTIECMQICDENAKAQQLINERIAVEGETELLVCLRADIEENLETKIKLYEKSWEISGKRYARAQRNLGALYYSLGKYEASIQSYSMALKVNPQYASSWFRMGCAALNLESWSTAQQAFLRVVYLRPDDSDAWNNLANSYYQCRKYQEAYHAFKEALKHQQNNWKLWENYLLTTLRLKKIQDAIYAMNKLLDIKNEVDSTALEFLVKSITDQYNSNNPEIESENKKSLKELKTFLGKVTAKISNNAELWKIYAYFYEKIGNVNKFIDFKLKQCKALQSHQWEKNEDQVKNLVDVLCTIVKNLTNSSDKSRLYGVKLQINSIIRQLEQENPNAYAAYIDTMKNLVFQIE